MALTAGFSLAGATQILYLPHRTSQAGAAVAASGLSFPKKLPRAARCARC
jgi:hypothetical protein